MVKGEKKREGDIERGERESETNAYIHKIKYKVIEGHIYVQERLYDSFNCF